MPTWHAFDLASGRRGVRLNTRTQGTPTRILCAATQVTVEVLLGSTPQSTWDVLGATQKGSAMLALLDDDANETPLWAGMVVRRVGTAASHVTCDLVTLEGWFDRRFTRDYSTTGRDQTLIAADLATVALAGSGLVMTVDATTSAFDRDRTYLEDEDKTVLSDLTELAEIEDGIDFTVEVDWADPTHTLLRRTLRIRDRIGTTLEHPTAVFTMPGNVVDFEYVEDFTADNGANAVQATSSGEGDTRPESAWQTAIPPGQVRFERKITPTTSITRRSTLNAHARAELAQTWDGLNVLTLDAHLETAPRVNVDWWLGDDVAVSLTCPRFPERTDADGMVVAGYVARVRAIGWEINLDERRLRPILLESAEPDLIVDE